VVQQRQVVQQLIDQLSTRRGMTVRRVRHWSAWVRMMVRTVAMAFVVMITSEVVAIAQDRPPFGADSLPRDGVPAGKILTGKWLSEQVYPGTERDYWIYVPAGSESTDQPLALMVFQDGQTYVNPEGPFRTPVVLDNLIEQKKIPPMVGIFVNPGVIPAAQPGQKSRNNRSFEYDSLGDRYARFLLEELLPGLSERHQLKLSADPEQRGICGISSGAICAFTVAWQRPDAFRKVLSHIGSFTNIRGGHDYAAVIRKTDPKPLRIALQEGIHDLDNLHGSWPLANRQLVDSLEFVQYDYRFTMTGGGHSGTFGGVQLPADLTWLWRPAIASR
jgi:enterochelin esterase-like enzyme